MRRLETRQRSPECVRGGTTIPCLVTMAVVLISVAASSCATGGGRSASADACGLRAADSVFATSGPVYRDCAVSRRARLINPSIHPDYRPTSPRTACYMADLEFVVDAKGKPELGTARVARTNDQGFADAVMATLSQWRYEPASHGDAAVRQIVTEHRSMQTAVVVVPAGTSPSSARPLQRPPSC